MTARRRPAVTFRQAATKYLGELGRQQAADRAAYAMAHLLPAIGDLQLTHVYDGALQPYIAQRKAEGAAAGTINKELGYVARITNLAARVWRHPNNLPYLDTAPLIRLVPGAARKPYPLTTEEQGRLLGHMPLHLATACLFAIHTGLRSGELTSLRWEWELRLPGLDVPCFLLPATVTKSGLERVVVLNRVARRVIEAQRGKCHTTVFSYEGRPVTRLLNSAFIAARVRAGLPQVRAHDLRHTFGSRLRAAGVSFEDRQDLLGHTSSRGITTHYSAVDLGRLLEAVEKLVEVRAPAILRLAPIASLQGVS